MIISKDLKSEKRTSTFTINKLNMNITHLMGDVKLLQNEKESDESGCCIFSVIYVTDFATFIVTV